MRSAKHRRRKDKLQSVTLFHRLHSECGKVSVHLPPCITRNVLDFVGGIHRRFVECKLLGYFGDGVKHWHDPIVEDVKVSCAQPEALQSETRAEIDERPFHWQRFEQRILVSVESQSGIS